VNYSRRAGGNKGPAIINNRRNLYTCSGCEWEPRILGLEQSRQHPLRVGAGVAVTVHAYSPIELHQSPFTQK
jgi:hypothetical protein